MTSPRRSIDTTRTSSSSIACKWRRSTLPRPARSRPSRWSTTSHASHSSGARGLAGPFPGSTCRASLGIDPLDDTLPPYEQLWARCDGVLAATLRQFDDVPDPLPANLRYVGPILDPVTPDWDWDLPVAAGSSRSARGGELQLDLPTPRRAAPARDQRTRAFGRAHVGDARSRARTRPDQRTRGTVVRQWVPHSAVLPHARCSSPILATAPSCTRSQAPSRWSAFRRAATNSSTPAASKTVTSAFRSNPTLLKE